MGANLATQPDRTAVHDELNDLIDDPGYGLCRTAACGSARTRDRRQGRLRRRARQRRDAR